MSKVGEGTYRLLCNEATGSVDEVARGKRRKVKVKLRAEVVVELSSRRWCKFSVVPRSFARLRHETSTAASICF